jgi:[protein-PII] uridylyltransferase
MTDTIKQLIASRMEAIAIAHRAGADGFATCASLTATIDEAIHALFARLTASQHIAVLAIGGYGRAELCPKSDIDVMVLCDAEDKRAIEEQVKVFLQNLWDAGLDVGHSVRTCKEALAQHDNAVESWASMLEGRFLCGDKMLVEQFFGEMRKVVERGKDKWFIEGVFDEVRARHERFGASVKLLEPNVKKSAGGLRDFQALFWLMRGNDARYFFPIHPGVGASRQFLEVLTEQHVLEDDERAAVQGALEFLFRTRHEMHFHRQAASDGLEYTLQRDVADALGFGQQHGASAPASGRRANGRTELHAAELFMREYHLQTRTIYRLYQNLSQRFREMVEPVHFTFHRRERLSDLFVRSEDMLTVDAGVDSLESAEQLFTAFVLCAEHEIDLHPRLRSMIAKSAELIDDEQRTSPALATQFRRVLNSRRVARTLYDMNELNVLAAYIPEWNDLVAFFQHNVYHYYTADEHTLIALANAEHLREQPGVMREVFRNLRRKDLLYLAILLHDIGKPRGVADHEITGVAIARDILERIGMGDAYADLAFLIRNHLVMEQVAFRRNIHDPATIKEFAVKFERADQLDYLFLLTYADLSAVNKNVWTEWKSLLLQELYHLTSEVLRRNLKGAQIDEFKQMRYEKAAEGVVERLSASLPREHIEEHLEGISSDAYVALFTDKEIEQHIHKSRTDETVSTLFARQEGYTEVTVIAEDAPFALSKFCAVLSANDANIFDANIFTREDGIIIDRFRVTDAATKGALSQAACAKIATDLNNVMEGKLDIEHLFAAHRRKWKRRQKPPANPNIRTDVQFEENPRYTIIDVYAPDSLGFLYRITETISKLGLNIYFAKIATRVDGILDAFYVLDRDGKQLNDEEVRAFVKQEILDTIAQISRQELASLGE